MLVQIQLLSHEPQYTWSVRVVHEGQTLENDEVYTTNPERKGLWHNNQQILGTFQFVLAADDPTAQAQIEQYFREKWQYGLSKRLSIRTLI